MNVILLTLFIFINLFPQIEEEEVGWNYSEIFIITRGLDINQTIRYKMESISTVWTKPDTDPPSDYSITEELNIAYYPPIAEAATGNTQLNSSLFNVGGFNFIGGNNQLHPYPMDSYGYGVYKISNPIENIYFYIDYRDNRYRTYYNSIGHPQDIWVRYNASTNNFSYSNEGPSMNDLDGTNWINIEIGEYLSIWEIKNQLSYGSPVINQFPQYWQNSLAVIDEDFHPKLIWSTDAPETVTHYKI